MEKINNEKIFLLKAKFNFSHMSRMRVISFRPWYIDKKFNFKNTFFKFSLSGKHEKAQRNIFVHPNVHTYIDGARF